MSRATRRLAVIATAIATVAAGLIAAPAASGETVVSTSSFNCNAPDIQSSGVTVASLSSGDSLRISVSGNCNLYTVQWDPSRFTGIDNSAAFGNGSGNRKLSGFSGTAGPSGLLAEVVSVDGMVRIAIRQGGAEDPDSGTSSPWTAKTPPLSGTVGTAYAGYTFVAPEGTGDYSVQPGTLPSGLELNAITGVLSGTPNRLGSFTFEISRGGAGSTGPITIQITAPVVSRVTLCHATASVRNPYRVITVSVNSIVSSSGETNGHGDHGKDIIPPFTRSGGVTYPGKNWDDTWPTPIPTSGWLTAANMAAVVPGTTSDRRTELAKCISLADSGGGTGALTPEAQEIDAPQDFFNVMVAEGIDPEDVLEDLAGQGALDTSQPGEEPVTLPTLDEAIDAFNNPDTNPNPPAVATDSVSEITRNSAVIRGSLASGTWNARRFEWSTSSGGVPGSGSNSVVSNPSSGATSHELTGLTCGTQYFYRLTGTDNASQVRNGLTRSFTTAACPTLSVTTQPASNVTTTSATLNGALSTADDPNWVTRTFQWSTSIEGVTSSRSTSTTSTGSSGGSVSHVVTGLTCGTQYFFRVTGTDDTPQSANGSILNFTTAACPTGTPPGTSSTPPVIPPAGPPVVAGPPAFTPTLGSGRPPRLRLPPSGPPNRVVVPNTPGGTNDPNGTATTPNGQTPGTNTPGTNGSSGTNGGGDGGTNPNTPPPGTNGTGTTTAPPTPITTVYVPRTLTPTTSVPAPPGTEWEPTQTRIQDPQTGAPVMRVSNEAGIWVVNERSGDVTYTPRVGFTGAANVNVVLVARSGAIYIHPMRVPITFNARVRIISGDVPRDIAGGVARVNGPARR